LFTRWDDVGNFSAAYCQTMREDLAAVGEMMRTYGSRRVRAVRYENLADSPLSATADMYRFLGLDFTDTIRDFVFNKTMAGSNVTSAYSTTRSDSKQAANSWRDKVI
jgi:hypothetical protein